MAEPSDWEIGEAFQPRTEDVSYDLERTLSAVVSVRTKIPEDAFTSSILGTERAGNGVLINENGLVLTIGYLITEADSIWLLGSNGRACQAHQVAYDQETGFGLVQALERLDLPVMELGSSADLKVGEGVIVAGFGGREQSTKARVVAKREFAGYWEYVLDEAIFTTPPHPNWGGAGLISADGRLAGVGSLFVQQPLENDRQVDGNMIVPIDILKPIVTQLTTMGGQGKPARPWLGMYTAEAEDQLVVVGLATDGPADDAGVEVGDRVIEVDGEKPRNLADMFRRVWALGPAGALVPLTLWREGDVLSVAIKSADRNSFLISPSLH